MNHSKIRKVLSTILPPSTSITLTILQNWKEIAGDFFYRHSVPYKFFVKKLELYLVCDDPLIANEVYFNQEELKNKIKTKTKIKVKSIKTVYNINKFFRIRSTLEHKRKYPKLNLSTEEKEKIEKLTSRVEDTELKEALRIFFETLSKVRKLRKHLKSHH